MNENNIELESVLSQINANHFIEHPSYLMENGV